MINWQESLPQEAQQRREVFARFGLAMYRAQCVEQQVGILLATIFNRDFIRSTPEERDTFFDREFAKTLGRLVTALRQQADLAQDFESRLRRGVELSNWLAHHYFWERAASLFTSEGHEQMIVGLEETTDFLGVLDIELTTITEEWLAKVGVSKELIDAELSKYLSGHDS